MEPSLRQAAWVNSVHIVYPRGQYSRFLTDEGLEKLYAAMSRQKLNLPLARLIPACWLIDFSWQMALSQWRITSNMHSVQGRGPSFLLSSCFALTCPPPSSYQSTYFSLTLSFLCVAGTAWLYRLTRGGAKWDDSKKAWGLFQHTPQQRIISPQKLFKCTQLKLIICRFNTNLMF